MTPVLPVYLSLIIVILTPNVYRDLLSSTKNPRQINCPGKFYTARPVSSYKITDLFLRVITHLVCFLNLLDL